MDINRFNQIVVLDSVPEGDYNTARRLHEDIQTYANAYSRSPAIQYVRIESAEDFFRCIDDCRLRTKELGIVPMLHVECHGNEDGFQFADGSLSDWSELKQPLTDLNIATELNLMIAKRAPMNVRPERRGVTDH